jgi:hypothetical protein
MFFRGHKNGLYSLTVQSSVILDELFPTGEWEYHSTDHCLFTEILGYRCILEIWILILERQMGCGTRPITHSLITWIFV